MTWAVRVGRGVGAVVLAGAAVLGTAAGAGASVAQSRVVSEHPAAFTPNLLADFQVSHPAVFGLEQAPSGTMYAGGEFHSVQNAARTTTYVRHNLMAFDARTGALSTRFTPAVNGAVWAVRISPDGRSLYAAGSFTRVGAYARRGLVKLDAVTGAVDPRFDARFPVGEVTDLRVVAGRLIAGGTFPASLSALSLATGGDTGYLRLSVAGTVARNAGRTGVYRFAVAPDGRRLVAIGNWTTVNGQPRHRAFMVDLGLGQGALASWHYAELATACSAPKTPAQLRDVDFSPDGSYFVIVATGRVPVAGHLGRGVCDAAARFETRVSSPSQPTWINYTGGDTLHSVAVTGAAVYVSGHNRWLDNPQGVDTCKTTCVSRQGIGAIDPRTGRALAWNPGKTRGVGGKDLLATSAGLWVASDGKRFDGQYRYGIAFCPL